MAKRKKGTFNADLYLNRRYGKWTTLEYVELRGCSRIFKCRCDCGTISNIQIANLVRGNSSKCKYCGSEKEVAVKRLNRPLWQAWRAVITRFKYDQRWNEFNNFQLDIGELVDEYRLEPIDVNLPIGPHNYRWAIGPLYCSSAKRLTIGGVTKECREWVKLLGLSRERVRQLYAESLHGPNLPYHKLLKRLKLHLQHVPEWNELEQFKKDIGKIKSGHRPEPIDASKPIGPGNWEWVVGPNYRRGKIRKIRVSRVNAITICGIRRTKNEWLKIYEEIKSPLNQIIEDPEPPRHQIYSM